MSHLFYFRDGSVVHPRETKTTSAIHKTVFLINPKDYKNITVTDLATLWHGTGFIGWEYELAGIFLCKVHENPSQGKICVYRYVLPLHHCPYAHHSPQQ